MFKYGRKFLLTAAGLLFIIPFSTQAQVSLEINDNMLVETTSSAEVEISGDLIENGSGYLQGIANSGVRTSVAQFAGMTISSPLSGSITRVTGSQYQGPGVNFTRYYEIDNQNASTLVSDVSTETIPSEAGSLEGPFFHYTINSAGTEAYGYGSDGPLVTSINDTFPGSSVTDLIISEGVGFRAKVFLEGPFNAGAIAMNTNINGDLPLTSPYSEDARTASAIPAGAVDWVLVQLRSPSAPSQVEASHSAFLDAQGNLIDDNATTGRGIGIAAPPGNYFVSITHRNHLAVMTADVQSGLTWGTASTVDDYDFTAGSSMYYGGSYAAKELISGIWGMMSGNANTDGSVDAVDLNEGWRVQNGTGWNYSKYADFNLDGSINEADRNDYWRPNNGRSSQIP